MESKDILDHPDVKKLDKEIAEREQSLLAHCRLINFDAAVVAEKAQFYNRVYLTRNQRIADIARAVLTEERKACTISSRRTSSTTTDAGVLSRSSSGGLASWTSSC